jgi:glycosyltransferase involved in cell wall biosynthesis
MTPQELSTHIGFNLLGPVFLKYLLKLHSSICQLDNDETVFLFCARAGIRINDLYKIFLLRRDDVRSAPKKLFWSSRIGVAKGVYLRQPRQCIDVIAAQYYNLPVRNLVEGLFRYNLNRLKGLSLEGEDLKAHGFNFAGWLTVKSPVQKAVGSYLTDCSQAFETYLYQLVAGKKRVVLVDSGWGGTMQSLLSSAFLEVQWKGLYFGRTFLPQHDPSISPDAVGLMFESEEYDSNIPESAFVRHRHLIESILESNGPSIEEIPAKPFKRVADALIKRNLDEALLSADDALYASVVRYVEENAGSSLSSIYSRHRVAIRELERIITSPTREEAEALRCRPRSADFGKTDLVDVLIKPTPHTDEDIERRIQSALWTEGQIALEYDSDTAAELQKRSRHVHSNDDYFDPTSTARTEPGRTSIAEADIDSSKVAIITRTKNRSLLLRRAARSVESQTFNDYLWIIVNDGGDCGDVLKVINACAVDRRRIRIVSNSISLGMEAASNLGIRQCQSKFIVIHDDDDSWEPEFLRKTVEYLESPRGSRYGGVITHSTYVSEEIRRGVVIEHERYPYMNWVRNVQLAEMACGNIFPPIAFLYRREVFEKVGGCNESLPVLGDWFFNMEFLLHADIGVLHDPLARYHHRDRGDSRSGVYANSVIGGGSKHEEYAAVARNEFLRRYGDRSIAAIVTVLGYLQSDVRARTKRLEALGETRVSGPSRSQSEFSQSDRAWVVAQLNRRLIVEAMSRTKHDDNSATKKSSLSLIDTAIDQAKVLAVLKELNCTIATPPDFDEEEYRARNQDVDLGIRQGKFTSGYMHYLMYGAAQGRERTTKAAS